MKKLVNELKENKYTTIAIVGFLCFILVAAIVYNLVMPSTGTPIYGDRLDGIEKVEIKESDLRDLEQKFEKNSLVKNANVSISGKTVNAIVTVSSSTSVDKAKKLSNVYLEFFDDDQIDFYDLQIFIKNQNENNKKFPIIGYKNIKSEAFSFSYSK